MTQADILKFLERNKSKKFEAKEIANAIKISDANVSLKKLRERGDVLSEWVKKDKTGKYLYWAK